MRLTSKENSTFHLVGGLCANCGAYSFPRHLICPRCHHDPVDAVNLSGKGTVYSYTLVHARPPEGFSLPYAIGYVLLDHEQIVVPALFQGSEADLSALAIGQAVTLAENTANHQADYVFIIEGAGRRT